MKHISVAIFTLCVFGITTSAFAESLPETCKKKEQEIQGMTAQIATVDKEVAALKEKLDALKKQEEELVQQQKTKEKHKKVLLVRIKKEEKKKKKMCSVLAKCAEYEAKIDEIKKSIAPIREVLKGIREEIKESREAVEKLNKAVDAIEAEYQKLKCADLVAGQTDQPTINTCHDLFSKWNNYEIEINKLNEKVAALQAKYKATMKRLLPASLMLIKLRAEMKKSCDFSKRLPELDTMEKEQVEYKGFGDILGQMTGKMKKMRGKKFRKPKLERREGPAPKPEAKQPSGPAKAKGKAKGGLNISLKAKAKLKAKATVKAGAKNKKKKK